MYIEMKLKQIRKQKNITLSELSRKSGVSKTQINDIENNKKKSTLQSIILLAQALDVKVEDLYVVHW